MPASLDRPAALARVADNPHLPTLPAVALRVLEKAGEPTCTLADLEGVVSLDPCLCVQLLRTVNSALYGLPRAVTSIRQALSLLGTSAVRSLVLSLSLPALQMPTKDGEALSAFWRSSVAGAIVARELAIRLGWAGSEDFLVAGLLRDLGTLVLPQVFPDESRQLPPGAARDLSCEAEQGVYGTTHAEVGAYLLQRWRLPAEITDAIRYHHDPRKAPAATTERARVLHLATRIARLQEAAPGPDLWPEIKGLAAAYFGLNENQLLQFLQPLDRKMAEFAALARVDPGPWHHFPTVLAAAAELGKLTVAVSFEHLWLREQRDHAELEADYWRRAAARFHREAVRDPLTGCHNRGYFEDALNRSFRRARRRCLPVGCLFIDLNNFKAINDQHGHAFGDYVLKSVAGRLLSCARTGDLVARYGGDEFCLVVTPVTEAGLLSMARRLRNSVAGLQLRSPSGPVAARIAVGGAFCLPWRGGRTAAELVGTADAAMYEAKRGDFGIRMTALIEDDDRRFLAEVEKRLFCDFLLGRGRVTASDLADSPRPAAPQLEALPRIVRRLNWVSREEMAAVLAEQRSTGRPFVEVALARGALTRGQLAGLLALRQQPAEALAHDFVSRGLLTREEGEATIAEYYATLRAG